MVFLVSRCSPSFTRLITLQELKHVIQIIINDIFVIKYFKKRLSVVENRSNLHFLYSYYVAWQKLIQTRVK